MSKEGENNNLSLKGLQNITISKPEDKSTSTQSSREHVHSFIPLKISITTQVREYSPYTRKKNAGIEYSILELLNNFKAQLMIGRNPERWRLDAVGNPVFKYLKGCEGPLCHEYDHIIPFSKGGKTVVENCQVLQTTVNRFKSNKIDVTYEDMRQASPTIRFSGKAGHLSDK